MIPEKENPSSHPQQREVFFTTLPKYARVTTKSHPTSRRARAEEEKGISYHTWSPRKRRRCNLILKMERRRGFLDGYRMAKGEMSKLDQKSYPFSLFHEISPKKDRWNLKVLSSEKKLLLFHIWHSEKGDIFLFWEPPNWVNCGPEKKTLLRICILLFSILRPRCVRRRRGRGGDFNFRRATLLFPQNKRANIHYCDTSVSKGRTGLTFRIQLVRAASNSKHGENKKKEPSWLSRLKIEFDWWVDLRHGRISWQKRNHVRSENYK